MRKSKRILIVDDSFYMRTMLKNMLTDAGYEVEIRGDEYLILREREVHAVASTHAEGQTGLYL